MGRPGWVDELKLEMASKAKPVPTDGTPTDLARLLTEAIDDLTQIADDAMQGIEGDLAADRNPHDDAADSCREVLHLAIAVSIALDTWLEVVAKTWVKKHPITEVTRADS